MRKSKLAAMILATLLAEGVTSAHGVCIATGPVAPGRLGYHL
jgi:hypothetical protein